MIVRWSYEAVIHEPLNIINLFNFVNYNICNFIAETFL